MTRITLPIHGLVELIAGILLILATFAVDMSGTGTLLTFVAGVVTAGVGLGTLDTLPLATHRALDRVLVIGLSGAAIAAALGGAQIAAVLLLTAAAIELVLDGATRWSRPAPAA